MLFTIRRTVAVYACLISTTGCPSGQMDPGSPSSGAAGDGSVLAGTGAKGPTAGSAGASGGKPSTNAGGSAGGGIWYDPTFPSCGASTVAAQEVVVEEEVEVKTEVVKNKPVALYIMFDQSYSMSASYSPPEKWIPAVASIKSFLDSDKSKDIDVALQYFPLSSGKCDGSIYKTPEVNVGRLPAHAEELKDSLDDHSANAANDHTPIEGALRGVTEFCKSYQADSAHAGEKCIAVLVTDGKPERDDCEKDTTKLAKIAKDAHVAGVTTFAIGLAGAEFGLLNEIAQQGGAPDCDPNASNYACDVSSGADKLADALASIRDKVVTTETHTEIVKQVKSKALACEWTIPKPTDGAGFDPNLVNVRLTAGELAQTLVHTTSREACRDNAWYFDNPTTPTRLIACPTVCSTIEAAGADAKIDILLGCPTLSPD